MRTWHRFYMGHGTRNTEHRVNVANILFSIFLVWCLIVAGHFLRECWIIATRGLESLPKCYRWWCPEGIKNIVTRDP